MALHVIWAQASQVQIPSVMLEAWIQHVSAMLSLRPPTATGATRNSRCRGSSGVYQGPANHRVLIDSQEREARPTFHVGSPADVAEFGSIGKRSRPVPISRRLTVPPQLGRLAAPGR